MADNIELNPGTGGATIATDDVAGIQYQVVKLAVGADGAASLVANANPIPISDAGGSLTVDGTFWQATQPVSGTFWQATQPVSLASVPSHAVTNAGTFSVQVDGDALTALQLLDNVVLVEDAAHSSGDPGIMSLAVRNDRGASLAGTHGDYAPLSVDEHGDLRVRAFGPGTIDTFGHLVTGSLHNQIDIQWYRSNGTVGDLVTETNANGGTATATGGMATFSATTTASSQAKGVTSQATVYTAGAEVYALFTAAFTGTGSGTSYQRIGLYDANNGFFVGFEGGTFGIVSRTGAADTQVAKANFNLDTLTGATGSAYTRAGTPEAIDLTKLNVFRIRFGWVGSAPIYYDVLAPDGNWVTFHVIRQPNNAALPSVQTADIPFTCDVNSGNSGAALTILTNCWCAGTTQALVKLDSTLAESDFAQLTRSVMTGFSTAGGGSFENVKVNPSGELTVSAAVTGAALTSLQLIDDTVFTDDAAFTPGTSKLLAIGMQADETATDSVDEGDIGTPRMTLNRQIRTVTGVTTSGGATIFRSLDLDETEEEIKGTAGQIYWIHAINLAATKRYLKFYDATAASVSVGTTTPVLTFIIPTQGDTNGTGFVLTIPMGIPFATAICAAATTGLADADTGAPGANEVIVNIGYA